MNSVYQTGSGFRSLILSGLVSICAGLMIAACQGQQAGTGDEVKIVAHRGAMTERPENTMAAFQRAVELGADIVEIDVRTSRDGRLFILHDATLDRTTDARGEASGLSLEELQQLDAGSWFHRAWAGETIPSLVEVLHWANEAETALLLDLKEDGPEFTDVVSANVQLAGMQERVVVGVRSPAQARQFSERLPDASLLAFMGSPDEIEDYALAGVHVIRLWLGWLEDDPGLAGQVRQAGTKLMINGTRGEPEEAEAIMAHGPDWILIDDPARLHRSLEELKVLDL